MKKMIKYGHSNYVTRNKGSLPILLTCPHGGNEAPAGVAERTDVLTPSTCSGANHFSTGQDKQTIDITLRVAQRMYEIFGEAPYVVIADFHRKFIDANRPSAAGTPNCAFVSEAARPMYELYHHCIQYNIDQILQHNNNRGFLFDIHGTNGDIAHPADLYIGTVNNTTLQSGFSRDNLFTSRGLVGLLGNNDYLNTVTNSPFKLTVYPADPATAEVGHLNGGHTVRTYGRTINAIQLEIQSKMRDDAELKNILIEELAFSLVNSSRHYTGF